MVMPLVDLLLLLNCLGVYFEDFHRLQHQQNIADIYKIDFLLHYATL